MPTDNSEFRATLTRLFPELELEGAAKASGQRVVYFCRFRAPPPRTNRPDWSGWGDVVLKVSHADDPSRIAYMQMEIGVLANLNSPQFPRLRFHQIYSEVPETEEKLPVKLFVTVEEMVPSRPLSACLDEFNTEEAVLDLLVKLVEAMAQIWLHHRQLVHRDLKPDNILVRSDKSICVIDLGILRETGSRGITDTGAVHGPLTPLFCSPEQAQNDKRAISFKSDFFSLGTMAYQLLAGFNPFVDSPQDSSQAILNNVVSRQPKRLDKIGKCSKATADVIERMMAKEPYKRHRAPQLLLDELRAARGK